MVKLRIEKFIIPLWKRIWFWISGKEPISVKVIGTLETSDVEKWRGSSGDGLTTKQCQK